MHYYTVIVSRNLKLCDNTDAAAAPTSIERQTRLARFLFVSLTGGRQINYDGSVACVHARFIAFLPSTAAQALSCSGERQLAVAFVRVLGRPSS